MANGSQEGVAGLFCKISGSIAQWVGSAWAFMLAILAVVVWGVLGPRFHYSDTWQLVINTGTTIVTFIIVFLIQNTQNRDARAIHLKLDEIIRSTQAARNEMIGIESLSDADLAEMTKRYEKFKAAWERRKEKPAA